MFERTVEGPAGGYACHLCGDACVAEAHRGEGLYSRIREATESEIERRGSDFCGVFTRRATSRSRSGSTGGGATARSPCTYACSRPRT